MWVLSSSLLPIKCNSFIGTRSFLLKGKAGSWDLITLVCSALYNVEWRREGDKGQQIVE